jgi:hypothetical protein
MKEIKTLRVAGAVAAVAAVGSTLFGGSAAADEAPRGITSTIEMKGNNAPRFEGPDSILAGEPLQITNSTDPQRIGPHTFTLIEGEQLPRGREELGKCFQLKGVCKRVARAHRVDFQTFQVDRPNVEKGGPGWNQTFAEVQRGDSWYTETEDEATNRQVTASPGNLRYFCVVHPDTMRGKIEVLPNP